VVVLLHTQEAQKLGYRWSSSVLPGKFWNSTSNLAATASLHILSNSLITRSFNAIWSELVTALLKKHKYINYYIFWYEKILLYKHIFGV
jgi:hypothetical protein